MKRETMRSICRFLAERRDGTLPPDFERHVDELHAVAEKVVEGCRAEWRKLFAGYAPLDAHVPDQRAGKL